MADDDFRMTVQPAADVVEIVVQGTLNEASVLTVPEVGGRPIRIHGEGITRINSLGVSAWIRFMNALSQLGVPVSVRMSVAMASQASMISNFVEGATIESFAAPYVCTACEHAEEAMFGLRDEVPVSKPCPKCNQTMEFDDEIESYLSFRQAL